MYKVSTLYMGGLTIIFLLLAVCAPTFSQQALENGKLNLKFLGTVDGKSYFAEANLTMNWVTAREYCNSSGLRLASIQSLNEANFLVGRLFQDYEDYGFWTSAREARTHLGFVWDVDGTQPNIDNINGGWSGFGGSAPYYYCGFIRAVNSTILRMATYLCSGEGARVLCETF